MAVPVLSDALADPRNGTGLAMVCTFGDLTDVIWWRTLALPTTAIIGGDGRLQQDCPDWIVRASGQTLYRRIAGCTFTDARRQVVEALTATGDLLGSLCPTRHAVKFFEKGERPLEIVATRQLRRATSDICEAGQVWQLETVVSDTFHVGVTLA